MHYHIKVVLHNPIDPMFNFPEILFSLVIRTRGADGDEFECRHGVGVVGDDWVQMISTAKPGNQLVNEQLTLFTGSHS